MANDIISALRDELTKHGADGFRVERGGKHDRFYFRYDGREMFHIVASTPSDPKMHEILALRDVRRMIGVNQGNGPGERRIRRVAPRQADIIAPPPEVITVGADPMAPLASLIESESKTMEQTEVTPGDSSSRKSANSAAFEMPIPTNREREWLEEMLTFGEKERRVIIKKKVTPGLAAAMLELNLANRPFVETQIRLHEGRLLRGEFILTHAGIAFAKTRVLNDGQHRLMAIARSGVTADLQITFGAERAEFSVIDMGRQRRASDLIGMNGTTDGILRAGVARVLVVAETSTIRAFDPQIVSEKALEMKDRPATVVALALGHAMKHSKVCSAMPVAVAYYWIATRSPNAIRVNEFFQDIPTGEKLGGVKLHLREWLRDKNIQRMRGPLSGGAGGGTGLWRAAGIILAWNAWLKGNKTVRTLDWRLTNELPEPK